MAYAGISLYGVGDQPTTMFAHVLGVKGVAVVTTTNRVQRLPLRPAQGSRAERITCEACHSRFQLVLHSVAVTRGKRVRYLVRGLLGVPLGVFLIWLTFGVGITSGNPQEDNTIAPWAVPAFFGGLVLAVTGLAAILMSRKYDGVDKLRRLTEDGTASRLTQGHRLM
ncbi:hypothetical protein ACKI1I_13655 [Streptomyces turgidiscabies]|uniref:Uncharacterized protein n=1 Tax=Streptomyces turgidiscabies (strain Car8) TaxID=698760 RepID=L7F6W7_STRT8|nr:MULTISPECIES: hypothetical protein [Streptomyces]ELP67328.1 hypothetical protein STRTUCAR8_06065 [Streptomyces turgidiscabies Car8]MDX3492924.1 hypothetical protein [Streptomyces turgidiscabies]GAQ74296.1 hypothetical protein T45_06068 [Streptomyces turgidiscabies]